MPNISVYISQETKESIPELLTYYHAPSVSKLVEEALRFMKEEMVIERKQEVLEQSRQKENPQVP